MRPEEKRNGSQEEFGPRFRVWKEKAWLSGWWEVSRSSPSEKGQLKMGSPGKDSILLLLGSQNRLPKTSGIAHLKTTQHLLWAFNQIKPQV